MKMMCKIGFHNYKFVRTIRVNERDLIKVYDVMKCSKCGRIEMRLKDVCYSEAAIQKRKLSINKRLSEYERMVCQTS